MKLPRRKPKKDTKPKDCSCIQLGEYLIPDANCKVHGRA